MSFILEALKRAERSRRPGPRDRMHYLLPPLKERRQRFWPWVWVGGALLANAVVVGVVLRSRGASETPLRPAPPAAVAAAPAATALAPSVPQPQPVPEPPRETKPLPSAAPVASVAEPVTRPVDRTPPKQPEAARPATELAVRQPSAELRSPPQATAPRPSAPPVQLLPSTAPLPAETPPPAPRETAALRAPALTTPPPAVVKPPAPEPRAAPVEELPSEERQALPKLELNAHVYADDPAQRLVFINGQTYRTGQRIGGSGGPLVKEITPEGAVIDYGHGVVKLKAER
ncbi:MAG: general secretion pathway protein GspB [Deltaproteobacteria bacterium]|nr:general secretion pathway protein GspB [Deltaproteobacteria bacterium]